MEAYGRISAKRRSRTETERRSHKGTTLQGFTYTVKRFNISMLMEKEPVYLAFSTQKGGAGKTTLTVLVASYLHYVKGQDRSAEKHRCHVRASPGTINGEKA